MLDRLPLELIQLIVHLALPSHYSPSTYRERQDTLLALCKTSRLLRTVAQPVVFEVVELVREHAVERFVEVVKDEALGKRVKIVRFEGPLKEGGKSSTLQTERDLRSISRSCLNIVELRFYKVNLDLKWLEFFARLDHLVLSHGKLAYSFPFSLPTLRELSVFCTKLDPKHHLAPTAYPALKRVHLQSDARSTLSAVLPSLLDHIECLSLDVNALFFLRGRPNEPRVLINSHPQRLAEIANDDPSFLSVTKEWRLTTFVSDPTFYHTFPSGNVHALAEFVDELPYLEMVFARHTGLLPSRLYLPIDIQNPSILFGPQRTYFVMSFLAACKKLGIEVIFEPLPDPLRESFVSPEFRRRCNALKTKEEAEKEVERQKEEGGEGHKEK